MGWKGAEGGVEVAEQDLEGLLRMPRLSSATGWNSSLPPAGSHLPVLDNANDVTGGCREIAALEIGATSHMGRQS